MAESSVLARIKKLDEERARLIGDAKRAALEKAEAAVAELNSLGFSYRLVEGAGAAVPKGSAPQRRRSGMREQVLGAVRQAGPDGVTRAELLDALAVKGEKSGEQSVSNALSALKRAKLLVKKGSSYVAA